MLIQKAQKQTVHFNEVINMAIGDITQEQFLEAYNKHLPSKWIKFAFKYFSKKTKPEDKYVQKIFQGVLFTLFMVGFVATILKWSMIFTAISTFAFVGILVPLILYLFSAVILNNCRIQKIRKELGGISAVEYNALVEKFMD